MSRHRRLSALLVAVLVGAGLTLGVGAPATARTADPAVVMPTVAAGQRAGHDPATYYAGTEGLSGNALALMLNSIIDGNTFVPYTSSGVDVWKALKVLDRDPNDPTRIIDAYSGDSLDAANQCSSSCAVDGWNREHTWAQSRGGFNTSAGPGTDLFHMRPLRGNTNSSRGNKDFDNGGSNNVPGCQVCRSDGDSFEPRDSFKGDLARGLFYMDVRYNGDADDVNLNDSFRVDLRLWDQVGTSGSQIGKLSTLVAWSLADPPDAGERTRNNLIDADYQGNRNPFIDHPEWVCSIWGSRVSASLCADVATNTSPTTSPMARTIAEDSGPTTVALSGSDADNDPLTWSLSAPSAAHGTASISGSTLTYTPAADFNGQDVVGVTVSDGKGGSASTTVTITVTPVNDTPVATAQVVGTQQDTATVITLTGTDVDGDALTYAIDTHPTHGTVNLNGDQATYTPAPGFRGTDSFTFTVGDGTVSSTPATVSINVASVNHPPVGNAQQVVTDENAARVISLVGADPDGDALVYAIAAAPAHGTVVLDGNLATYTPGTGYVGPDSFSYTVSDGQAVSSPAIVGITVNAVNHAPTASAATLDTVAGTAVTVTIDATDVDDDTLAIVSATTPALGSVTFSDLEVTYTPSVRSGEDEFSVTVSDGHGGSVEVPVTVTIEARAADLVLSAPTSPRGTRATITITASGEGDSVPTGTVTLLSGDTPVSTAELDEAGVATISGVPQRSGSVPLRATYDGDDLFAPATSPTVTWTVGKAAAALGFDSGVLRRGRAGTITVAVKTVAGVKAGGSMTLTIGGSRHHARLVKGVATFTVAKLPRAARTTVKATYGGNAQYRSRTAGHTFALRK